MADARKINFDDVNGPIQAANSEQIALLVSKLGVGGGGGGGQPTIFATAAEFASGTAFPSGQTTLLAGQIGVETDTDKMKIGRGGLAYPDLRFVKTDLNNATFTGTFTVPDASFANAKLATMAAGTAKGRVVGTGAGAPVDLTPAQQAANIASHIGPNGVFATDAAGAPQPEGVIQYPEATVWDWLIAAQGVSEVGAAESRSRLYEDATPVDSILTFAITSPSSPEMTLSRYVETGAPVLIRVPEIHASLLTRRFRASLAVKNTGGAAIPVGLAAVESSGVTPIYLHGDHASAVPTVAPGALDFFDIDFDRGIAVIRKRSRTTAHRRRLPLFLEAISHGSTAETIFASQLAGDAVFAFDHRFNATLPTLRAGFTALLTGVSGTMVAGRISYRITAANAETITPASNAGSRNLLALYRHVDPVTPIIGTPAAEVHVAGTPVQIPIPAQVITSPAQILGGFFTSIWNGTAPAMPPEFPRIFGADENVGTGATRVGAAPQRLSTPRVLVNGINSTQAAVGFSFAIQGSELPA